jgi:SAM-dependent methyltransferase
MEVEGMVHALEEIHRLLKPDGCLIDIHPIRKAPLIKIHRGSDLVFTESDPGYDYDEGLRHADDALDEVIQRGVFRVEGKSEFELVTHASSATELQDYWAKYGAFDVSPKDTAVAARQNDVYAKASEIMRDGSKAEIGYYERARITRLKPISG